MRRRPQAHARARPGLSVWRRAAPSRLLLDTVDHGAAVPVRAAQVGAAAGDGWVQPFLATNRESIARLALRTEVQVSRDGPAVLLYPAERIGAVPLRSPQTRRVCAGLLVKPRFEWPSLGEVLAGVGFRVEPWLDGTALVPGSAREVPPWVIAGPVLRRIGEALARTSRNFILVSEHRQQPRGTVDWTEYARREVPSGRWGELPCRYPDLGDDPWLYAVLRWTVRRLVPDLETSADAPLVRGLLEEARGLLRQLGSGVSQRPSTEELERALGTLVQPAAIRAMLVAVGWVRDERGLGGERSLDGLTWSFATDVLWEAWVESVFGDLAARLGARIETGREGGTRRPLVWHTPVSTLTHLVPDLALQWPERTVWVDAKYKMHLAEVRRAGWSAMAEGRQADHRADVHQALAYGSLSDARQVDTWLVYPVRRSPEVIESPPLAVAEVTSGTRRRLRLILAGLPFGFLSPREREVLTATWGRLLAGATE